MAALPGDLDPKEYLLHVVENTDGLYGIIISDKEGVSVLQAWADGTSDLQNRFKSSVPLLSMFATMTEQAGKLGLSTCERFISFYGSYQLVQINKLPLVISLIAAEAANTGLMMSAEKELDVLIKKVKTVIDSPA